MRPLNPREKRLATIFGAIILLMANYYLLNYLFTQIKKQKQTIADLRSQEKLTAIWIEEKDLWTQRGDWIAKHQPILSNRDQASSDMLQKIVEKARNYNITISDQRILEPTSTPHYQQIAIELKIIGTLEQITRWIAEFQQPQNFYAITSCSIKSDAEPPKIICTLQIARWFAP
jgi:type II secretory pathway component PulM